MAQIAELLERWDSGEGKPYKGSLIDWEAFEANPTSIGCMCAQGQVLHTVAGWSPEKLRDTQQAEADLETAKLLNISIAHAILLRNVNDKADGAPSIVLTNPEKVLGDQAQIVLAFWLHLDRMTEKDWAAVRAAVRTAAWDAARDAAWAAAGVAVRAAARAAVRAAARAAVRTAAWDAARDAAWAAEYACSEIQGARLLREQGKPFFFLPMFGFADPESIPALPADYGVAA